MEINGKVALVLGATKGIGKAVALALAQQGARLILPYFDWPEHSQATIHEFAELSTDHLFIKTDLRDPDQINALCDAISQRYGELHILINNIERGGMPVVHGPYVPEQWDLEMDTTLKAKWWVFNACLPLLKRAEEGVVLNVSSIAGKTGRTGPVGLIFNDGYSAANRAISAFTETWAREAAPTIRVNELMLGLIETRHAEQTRGWDLLSEEQRAAIINHTLLKRTGRLEDVVRTALFLIKDAAYMTGSTIVMDGGYLLGGSDTPAMPPGIL